MFCLEFAVSFESMLYQFNLLLLCYTQHSINRILNASDRIQYEGVQSKICDDRRDSAVALSPNTSVIPFSVPRFRREGGPGLPVSRRFV